MSDTTTTSPTQQSTDGIVDAFFAAFGSGDQQTILDLFADTVDFRVEGAPEVPWTGTRSGREELADFFGSFGEVLGAPESFEVTGRVTQGSDAVVFAECVFPVLATGKKFANRYALRFSVGEGRIVRYHMYEDSYAVQQAFVG
ncbi:MAG: nuclear transport factor 2 family protein [Phycicoccus sp.]